MLTSDNISNLSTNIIQGSDELSPSDFIDEFNVNDTDNLMILNQNIRSFNSNIDEFLLFLNEIKSNISVIILTETWFSKDNFYNIPNFEGYHAYRSTKSGGGVSIFVHNNLYSCAIPDVTFCNDSLESCGARIKIGNNHKFINIIGIYRPPSGNRSNFCEILSNNILSKFSPQQQVCISGDMNLNLLNMNDPSVQEYSDLLQSKSFLPHITRPTRITDHSETLLDHIWTNILSESKSGVISTGITDHCCTFICLYHMGKRQSVVHLKFRDTSERSLNNFHSKLHDRLITLDLNDIQDVSSKTVELHDIMWNTFQECCPIRTKIITRNRLLSPWLSNEIILLSRMKRLLLGKVRSDLIQRQTFDDFSKDLKKTIKFAKINYYNSKFSHLQNDIKKTWKNINHLIGKPKVNKPPELHSGNEVITEPSRVAAAFNEHFSSVAAKLQSNIPTFNSSALSYLGPLISTSFSAPESSPNEVAKLINSMPNKKCGNDSLPTYVWKHCCDILAPAVSKLFNASLIQGVFPSNQKTAQVIPIHKGGSKTDVSNYRPISILPALSKVFERLMNTRLTSYLETNCILNKSQFGFRKGLSTSDAILEFLDHAYSSLDSKKHLIAIFLDLSKAFDTIDHTILLNKLQNIGVNPITLSWFKSYLSNRLQFVSIDPAISTTKVIKTGVPQGSILGPLLFLIYINDFHYVCNSLKFIQFADDTTLFMSGENMSELQHNINQDLANVFKWLCVNKLSLNISKTKYMIISNKHFPSVTLKIQDHTLECVPDMKFLGVTLDNKLTFKRHIQIISNKIASSVGILNRIYPFMLPKTMLNVYYALIQSILSYGILAWGKAAVTNLRRIYSLQKRAIKIIGAASGNRSAGGDSLILFNDLYKVCSLTKLYRCINTNHSDYFNRILSSLLPNHSQRTRHNYNRRFHVPYHRCQRSQQSFLYHSTRYWNELPESIKAADNLSSFKSAVKNAITHSTSV